MARLGDKRKGGIEGFPFNWEEFEDACVEKYSLVPWKYMDEFLYKESEKYIDKIMQWVEENKDNLRFKE